MDWNEWFQTDHYKIYNYLKHDGKNQQVFLLLYSSWCCFCKVSKRSKLLFEKSPHYYTSLAELFSLFIFIWVSYNCYKNISSQNIISNKTTNLLRDNKFCHKCSLLPGQHILAAATAVFSSHQDLALKERKQKHSNQKIMTTVIPVNKHVSVNHCNHVLFSTLSKICLISFCGFPVEQNMLLIVMKNFASSFTQFTGCVD